MNTLHIINQSPFNSSLLEDCLTVCAAGDSILFIQDGVLILQHAQALTSINVDFYVLTADAQARGLEQAVAQTGAKPASYDDFVALICSHQNSVSWS